MLYQYTTHVCYISGIYIWAIGSNSNSTFHLGPVVRLAAMSNTLRELLASQDELVREAALALPHSFSQCTYNLGYIRQAIYLCLTCNTPRGICYPCSVACHTDHEQVELFPKRHFRCDCPTGALSHPCGLHQQPEGVNAENAYGQNFEGKFCRCERVYNAHTEVETMIQCLACEVRLSSSPLDVKGS